MTDFEERRDSNPLAGYGLLGALWEWAEHYDPADFRRVENEQSERSLTAVEDMRRHMLSRGIPPCVCQKCGRRFYQLWLRTYEERLRPRMCARCAEWPTGIECVWVESERSAK